MESHGVSESPNQAIRVLRRASSGFWERAFALMDAAGEAVKRGLVVAGIVPALQPAVEIRLERVHVPARKIAPHVGYGLVGEGPVAEERQGLQRGLRLYDGALPSPFPLSLRSAVRDRLVPPRRASPGR